MAQAETGGQVVAPPAPETTSRWAKLTSVWILFILAGLILVFAILNGRPFFNADNFWNIAVDASELLLLAVGLTFVIITGGIDLSVGSVLVFASVVGAK